jgi:hypothetical protein
MNKARKRQISVLELILKFPSMSPGGHRFQKINSSRVIPASEELQAFAESPCKVRNESYLQIENQICIIQAVSFKEPTFTNYLIFFVVYFMILSVFKPYDVDVKLFINEEWASVCKNAVAA